MLQDPMLYLNPVVSIFSGATYNNFFSTYVDNGVLKLEYSLLIKLVSILLKVPPKSEDQYL